MRTVAVLSLKGGVGKTSVVLGLAGAAMIRGVRTLVVDLDPQGNATSALEPDETTATLADVLTSPTQSVLRAAIGTSSWDDNVDVLVGSEDVEVHNAPDPDLRRLRRLATALAAADRIAAEEESPYRLVLLDCPPSLGQLTRSALVAADRALLVTEPTLFSVTGVQRAFEAVHYEREQHNPELQPLGVVVNRVRTHLLEHDYRIRELREIFGPLVLPVILPDRSAVQHAQGACVPVQRWGTPGAREISLAYQALLARVLRTSRFRRPGADDAAAPEYAEYTEYAEQAD
ncbi:MAG TPA: ParA family protein [Pseudonocardiaceae bacterium]